VKRGAWVLERILATPPQPPPPTVKAVPPDTRGATTIREQLALHKNQEACAACHRTIDPPGFALENYDVIGGWRERYRVAKAGPGTERQVVPLSNGREASIYFAKAVDPTGETPDGKAFGDIARRQRRTVGRGAFRGDRELGLHDARLGLDPLPRVRRLQREAAAGDREQAGLGAGLHGGRLAHGGQGRRDQGGRDEHGGRQRPRGSQTHGDSSRERRRANSRRL
jgi:hypothetical protein